MSLVNKAKRNGVSLRITFLMMFIVVVAITSVLLIMSFYTLNSYNSLSEATDKYIELQDAAGSLMTARITLPRKLSDTPLRATANILTTILRRQRLHAGAKRLWRK